MTKQQKDNFKDKVENNELEPVDKRYYKLFHTIARIKDLSAAQKLLLVGIMSYNTDHEKNCHMSNERMAYEFGLSLTTIKNTLVELKKLELIESFKLYDRDTKRIVGRFIKCNNNKILEKYQKTMKGYKIVPIGEDCETYIEKQ